MNCDTKIIHLKKKYNLTKKKIIMRFVTKMSEFFTSNTKTLK